MMNTIYAWDDKEIDLGKAEAAEALQRKRTQESEANTTTMRNASPRACHCVPAGASDTVAAWRIGGLAE